MISITIKTNKGKERISIKSSWGELTLRELIKIEKQKKEGILTPLKLFSILTGKDFDALANSKDERLTDILSQIIGFINNTPDWQSLKPEKLYALKSNTIKDDSNTINNDMFTIPDVDKLTFGQKVLLTQLASQITEEGDVLDIFADAISIMMVPSVYGEFNKLTEDKIPELKERVLESGAIQSYALGQYFFLNCPILTSIGRSYLTRYHYPKMEMVSST